MVRLSGYLHTLIVTTQVFRPKAEGHKLSRKARIKLFKTFAGDEQEVNKARARKWPEWGGSAALGEALPFNTVWPIGNIGLTTGFGSG